MPLSWALPDAELKTPVVPDPVRPYGRDIQFRNGDYEVTPAGDWKTVEGEENLRLGLLRRLFTKPGEFRLFPTYGAGLRAMVKQSAGQSTLDAARNRARDQLLLDVRVQEVLDAQITRGDDGTVRLALQVRAKGRTTKLGPLGLAEEA